MNPLQKAYYITRYLGPGFVARRLRMLVEEKLKIAQRVYRARPWDTIRLEDVAPLAPHAADDYALFKREQQPPFLFPLGQPPAFPADFPFGGATRRPPLAERIRLLEQGRYVYFFHAPTREPIEWYTNMLTGRRGVDDRIWPEIIHYQPYPGDIRAFWESSRAVWAMDLARAPSHGVACDAPALFYRWLDSWMSACSPYIGGQWMCGQEASVRVFAISLAFWTHASAPATTPQRWVQFARLAWATGYRVAHHIGYAISQKNNHAFSEACGLLLISQLFPEFREAAQWRALGRKVLMRTMPQQIYADGSYVQQSMNYHRVMLDTCGLALRLAELNGDPFPRRYYELLERALEWLAQLMDESGGTPNYGANDGANPVPLHECDVRDYRPTLQSLHYLLRRERALPPGPWDEQLLWLYGPQALRSPQVPRQKPQSTAFLDGGYFTLRRSESWGMLRCHSYRDRVSHVDPLHLDLWWRGQNVLCDGGSYQYYDPLRPDLERFFKSIAGHNTVQVDNAEPLELVSRYLWFPWPRARVRRFETRTDPHVFVGESYAYARAPWRITHRRSVFAFQDDVWVIVDDLLGAGSQPFTLRWRMWDFPYVVDAQEPRVELQTPRGPLFISVTQPTDTARFDVVRGRDSAPNPMGLASPDYAAFVPAPTIEASASGAAPLRWVSVISPGAPRVATRAGSSERWRLGDREITL